MAIISASSPFRDSGSFIWLNCCVDTWLITSSGRLLSNFVEIPVSASRGRVLNCFFEKVSMIDRGNCFRVSESNFLRTLLDIESNCSSLNLPMISVGSEEN